MTYMLILTALADDTDQQEEEPKEQVQQVVTSLEQTEQKLDAVLQALAKRSEEDTAAICDSGVIDCYRVEFVGPVLPPELADKDKSNE